MTVFYMHGFSVFPWNSPGKKIIQVSTLKCSALHCHCRRRQPLVSLSSARKEEPGDAAANQKTCYSQHSSKPCWHITCGCRLCRRWNGEAVRHCEDVRMLLEHTLVKAFILVTLTYMNRSCHHAHIVQMNPNWVFWGNECDSCLTSAGHLMVCLAFVKLL